MHHTLLFGPTHDSGVVETTELCGRAPTFPGGLQEDLVPDLNRAQCSPYS